MDPMLAAYRYFNAWNHHDPEGIVASMTETGTYSDPATGGPIAGAALAGYAANMFAAFPDLRFEISTAAVCGTDTVVAQWVMRGTNTGPLNGPPTGQTVAVPGADIITIADGRVQMVQGYFDQRTFVEQLGLHVVLAPAVLHPPLPTPPPTAAAPEHGAYIAALWEHPTLCVAIFGLQIHTPEGAARYHAAGISMEVVQALAADSQEGLLAHRWVHTPNETVSIQYWRSYDDLDRWARKQPHARWWRWLMENTGPDLGFYHEIYQARTAEAIYSAFVQPVGVATSCRLEPVPMGKGHSRERQARFAAAGATS